MPPKETAELAIQPDRLYLGLDISDCSWHHCEVSCREKRGLPAGLTDAQGGSVSTKETLWKWSGPSRLVFWLFRVQPLHGGQLRKPRFFICLFVCLFCSSEHALFHFYPIPHPQCVRLSFYTWGMGDLYKHTGQTKFPHLFSLINQEN